MNQGKTKQFSGGIAVRLLVKLPGEEGQVSVERQGVERECPGGHLEEGRGQRADPDAGH